MSYLRYLSLFAHNGVQIRVITKLPNTEQSSKGKELISQQTDKISQQPENWENRNGPDLVQVFPKKWWVESNFTAPNLRLPLRLKGSGCHYNSIFIVLCFCFFPLRLVYPVLPGSLVCPFLIVSSVLSNVFDCLFGIL
jgi:hypothetical protein